MRRIPRSPIVAALVALGAACTTTNTPNETDTAAVRQAIDSSNARFAEHMKAGQMDQVASHYTEDAVLMPPNMPVASGRAAIAQTFGGMMQGATMSDFRLTSTDVQVSGDMALERGRYVLTMNMPGQGVMSDSGKFLVAWKRQSDGSWLMDSDIWNSDVAMTPPGGPAAPAADTSKAGS